MGINWVRFISAISICLLAGAIGSLFTTSEIPTWYAELQKPTFNPPNWIFGPVWTGLYICMGVALYIIWNSKAKRNLKKIALTYFFLQLFFNILWSIIFFGFHQIGVALVEIIILWVLILWTIIYFKKVSRSAAYLLYPYLGWVSFATILNVFLFVLN